MTHPYATASYAAGLDHVGQAFEIPEWGTYVLLRETPFGGHRDVVGVYPIMVLSREANLAGGLQRLKAKGIVSIVLVLDDLLRPPLRDLEAIFDFVRPFKSHYLHDWKVGDPVYNKHHRYEIRRAGKLTEAREFCLGDHLAEWQQLYGQLVQRHGLRGTHAFPAAHHEMLGRLEGVRSFGAFIEGKLVAAHIFVTHEGHAMSHLAAATLEGYRTGAAYAVNALALEHLDGCGVVNLGGAAGVIDDPSDGLARFKKGFSNSVASSYLCGAVLDRPLYQKLSAEYSQDSFFPAYRGSRIGAISL